ncbi:MAG: hypothetical protein ACRD2W_14170 [Acidimicrobiales bacterium]
MRRGPSVLVLAAAAVLVGPVGANAQRAAPSITEPVQLTKGDTAPTRT